MLCQMFVSIVPPETNMLSDTEPAVGFTFNRGTSRFSRALKAFRISIERNDSDSGLAQQSVINPASRI